MREIGVVFVGVDGRIGVVGSNLKAVGFDRSRLRDGGNLRHEGRRQGLSRSLFQRLGEWRDAWYGGVEIVDDSVDFTIRGRDGRS